MPAVLLLESLKVRLEKGGDCSSIDTSSMMPLFMESGGIYVSNVNMLHESIPVQADCQRTLVRITLPSHFELS